MPPQTGTALILLVAFVLPGFVTVLFQERTFKSAEDPTPLDRLLRAVYYSVWVYLLLAIVALAAGIDRSYLEETYENYESDPAELVWRAALAILIPSVAIAHATRYWAGASLRRRLFRKLKVNPRHDIPTAWDHFFRQQREAYVRVTLKDEARVLGYYGSESFAAYAKDGRDLYLEDVYSIDEENDWFGDPMPGSCGVWIPTDDVVCVELYSPGGAEPGQASEEALREEGPSATHTEARSSATRPEATT